MQILLYLDRTQMNHCFLNSKTQWHSQSPDLMSADLMSGTCVILVFDWNSYQVLGFSVQLTFDPWKAHDIGCTFRKSGPKEAQAPPRSYEHQYFILSSPDKPQPIISIQISAIPSSSHPTCILFSLKIKYSRDGVCTTASAGCSGHFVEELKCTLSTWWCLDIGR